MVVTVLRVTHVGCRHHEDRDAAPVEGARDRPLLRRDPAHRSPFEEDGHGDAPLAGADEALCHGRIGELVDIHQNFALCRRDGRPEYLIRTVGSGKRGHRYVLEGRGREAGLADEERARVPDAVLQVVDLAFPGVDVGRPGDLLEKRGPPVEVEFVGLIGHQEVPVRDHVRHGRCVLFDLEVGRVAVGPLERGAVSRDHQPPADLGSRREPEPAFTVGDDEPVKHPLPLEHQVLVGIAGQIGVRAELGDQDAIGHAGKKAEEQESRGDPAHTQGYVFSGLIGRRYDFTRIPAGRQSGRKPL